MADTVQRVPLPDSGTDTDIAQDRHRAQLAADLSQEVADAAHAVGVSHHCEVAESSWRRRPRKA